jgi:hypothetical protein
MSMRLGYIAAWCIAACALGVAGEGMGQNRDAGTGAGTFVNRAFEPVAACAKCNRFVSAILVDQQEVRRLQELCYTAMGGATKALKDWEQASKEAANPPPGTNAFQASKAKESAKAGFDNAKKDENAACGRMEARDKLLASDIDALKACNATCPKVVPDPPKKDPPPKDPPPDPPKPGPKPASGPGKTITHVTTTCAACQPFADAANAASERCSAGIDQISCANMQMYLGHLAACEEKECASATNSVGAVSKPASPPNKPAQTPQQQPQLQRAPQTPAKQPAQQAVKPAAQPTSQPQSGQQLKLPPKQPTPQVVQPTQQQSGLKLPPKAPTQQGSQPVLQQQPNQQGVLKLPPKPLPAEETKQQKAGVITQQPQ